jgi:pimeloyl-ACP methyl ester carboxylesterase
MLKENPVFGGFYLFRAPVCTGWPVTRDPVPLPTATDAPPILVIGGTNDSRTPYEWAPVMTETLGNATLLTSEHWGHGAVTNGGDCVRLFMRAYLTSGSLPAAGTACGVAPAR